MTCLTFGGDDSIISSSLIVARFSTGGLGVVFGAGPLFEAVDILRGFNGFIMGRVKVLF